MADQAPPANGPAISFGPFRLLSAQQLLLEGDKPVRLGSRALDILKALVERAGELVTKEELVGRVWPNTFVEEGNLRVHVAALRRALGDGHAGARYILNVPGRGYRFVASLSEPEPGPPPTSPAAPDAPAHHLPAPLTRMVGRSDVVDTLLIQVPQRRFITLVGPGGIGKTTVALAVAHQLSPSYRDGVRFADLAPVTDPQLAASTLASALGVAIRSDNPRPGLTSFLADKDMLIVLDSCEHLVSAAACLAEDVFENAPGVHVLATSREPLRAEGERIVRLSGLDVPDDPKALTAAEALAFPAVQLFVERAMASQDSFELTDANVHGVIEICRRLDGIALAIEMAAGRLDTLGLAEIAGLLDDRFRLLTRGRRTALARHRTLRATVDWSHGLLPEFERLILRRLGIFAGWFTAQAAGAVLPSQKMNLADVIDGIADLVGKSLVVADVGGPTTFYRLLETTRAYALEKLDAAGEIEAVSRSHAHYYCELFERAEAEWETRPTGEWLAEYRPELDNLRAALDWAFSPKGDVGIGVPLTVAAAPLWLELSLMEECRARTEQALAALDQAGPHGDRRKMHLYTALAWSEMYTTGSFRQTGSIWAKALELAEALDDTDYQLRALWGLWANSINKGRFRDALALAKKFSTVAATSGQAPELLIGDRMTGASLHFLGDQTGARRHIERMLGSYERPKHRSHLVRFQFDQRITAHITLSRVLWLQGLADQAMATVQSSIDRAQALGHTLSLCNDLAQAACPVALLAGDLPAAERFTTLLLDLTTREALDVWHAYGKCFQGQLLLRRGDPDGGVRLLRGGVDKLRNATFVQYLTAFLGSLAEGCAAAGQISDARAAIDEALARCEDSEERWSIAELLRIRGEIALHEGGTTATEEHFLHALDWSRRQEALAWELRTATSLARLRHQQGRTREGRELLAPVYARFAEGFATADLVSARTLLDQLAQA
ncbi:MAG TPA: winged helix-turn-helix domain-containing protein [Beijerinckiaceae bacterium]